jgi:predicted nucleotidyltransferase
MDRPQSEPTPHALGMATRHRELVLALLNAHAVGAEVWAYGSRVKGTSGECSDLDLVLINPVDPSQATNRAERLRQAFVDSLLPFSVDVSEWAWIPEAFRREIERDRVRLT